MNHKLTLRILLVLSMLNAGMSALAYLAMAVLLPQFQQVYEAQPDLVPETMHVMWERMAAVPRLYHAAWALLNVLSLAGCILMWNLRRSGFHAYAIAQLLLLLLPLLFLGKGYMGLGDIMFTGLFLLVYFLLLKSLGVFDSERADVDQSQGSNGS
ncbi:MAG: hypothetical protein J6I49_08125 [Bacteroidales bacterium]|nr:hypothetical protein [Bacteroidales bacterium]